MSTAGDRKDPRREGTTAILLGAFLAALALAVLTGIFFADAGIDRWLNLGAGLVILGVGLGFIAYGRRSLEAQ